MTEDGEETGGGGVDPSPDTLGAPDGARGGGRAIAWVALASLVLGVALCGLGGWTAIGKLAHLGAAAGGPRDAAPATTEVVRPTVDVVVAVRDLARLETAQYHMERVIDLEERQRRLFGLLETSDAILLVAAGDVRAGVDLGAIEDDDVDADLAAGTARLVLPAPEVLSARLDEGRTYVHTRRTDTLGRRSETLETRARQEAERTIREAAVEAGILDRARDNARRTVTSLVRSLGFGEVTVRYRDE